MNRCIKLGKNCKNTTVPFYASVKRQSRPIIIRDEIVVTKNVKKICICEYLQIKPVICRKWIFAGNGYGYFLYPHVNRASTCIIVFIPWIPVTAIL